MTTHFIFWTCPTCNVRYKVPEDQTLPDTQCAECDADQRNPPELGANVMQPAMPTETSSRRIPLELSWSPIPAKPTVIAAVVLTVGLYWQYQRLYDMSLRQHFNAQQALHLVDITPAPELKAAYLTRAVRMVDELKTMRLYETICFWSAAFLASGLLFYAVYSFAQYRSKHNHETHPTL